MYYFHIKDNVIVGKGQVKVLNMDSIEVDKDVYDNSEKYIYKDGGIIIDTEYQEKQAQKEKERIAKLTCTKRVFALMLQQMGVDYLTMLKPLIESNPQAQLEWELCVELERGNPLIDVMAEQLGVSSDKLDALFKFANNEITQEEFVQAITPQEETEDEIQEETEEIEEEVEEVVE